MFFFHRCLCGDVYVYGCNKVNLFERISYVYVHAIMLKCFKHVCIMCIVNDVIM